MSVTSGGTNVSLTK